MKYRDEHLIPPLAIAASITMTWAIFHFEWHQEEIYRLVKDFGSLAGGIIGATGAYLAAVYVFKSQKQYDIERYSIFLAIHFLYIKKRLLVIYNFIDKDLANNHTETIENQYKRINNTINKFISDYEDEFLFLDTKDKIHSLSIKTMINCDTAIGKIKVAYLFCKKGGRHKNPAIFLSENFKDINTSIDTAVNCLMEHHISAQYREDILTTMSEFEAFKTSPQALTATKITPST